jgi:capsular polysaccharide biosynthesis protein
MQLLERKISLAHVPRAVFVELEELRGQLCDDIHGALPYGLFAVPQGIVFGAPGILFARNVGLLKEQNYGNDNDEHLITHLGTVSRLSAGPSTKVDIQHVLSLVAACSYCFWHWMLDSLPKVILAEKVGYAGSYLIPPSLMAPWARESLSILGIESKRVFEHTSNIVEAEVLYIPTYFSGFHAFKNLPLLSQFRKFVRDTIGVEAHQQRPRRLFVPRKPEAQARRIMNFDEVRALLERFEFETLYFEDLALKEQLQIACQAHAIVSPHGSGMTHSLFMQEGSLVIELFPFTRRETCPCYEALMPLAKHRYRPLESTEDAQSDIQVDLEKLEQVLRSEQMRER